MPDTPWQRQMSSDPDAEPVVENPRRPLMTDKAPRPRKIRGDVVLMPDEPANPKGSRNRMKPAPDKPRRPALGPAGCPPWWPPPCIVMRQADTARAADRDRGAGRQPVYVLPLVVAAKLGRGAAAGFR